MHHVLLYSSWLSDCLFPTVFSFVPLFELWLRPCVIKSKHFLHFLSLIGYFWFCFTFPVFVFFPVLCSFLPLTLLLLSQAMCLCCSITLCRFVCFSLLLPGPVVSSSLTVLLPMLQFWNFFTTRQASFLQWCHHDSNCPCVHVTGVIVRWYQLHRTGFDFLEMQVIFLYLCVLCLLKHCKGVWR